MKPRKAVFTAPRRGEGKVVKRDRGTVGTEHPILLTDTSWESSQAFLQLTFADLPFALVRGQGTGLPTLFSSGRSFAGLEGIERYIQERKASRR